MAAIRGSQELLHKKRARNREGTNRHEGPSTDKKPEREGIESNESRTEAVQGERNPG